MKMNKFLYVSMMSLFFSLLLVSCSTFRERFGLSESASTEGQNLFTEEQCMQVDFYQLGFNDGQAGKPQRNLENYVDEHGCRVQVNEGAYHSGWNKGMQSFCRPTYMMGLVNGRTGEKLDRIDQRAEICQQYGFHFDANQYYNGQSRGMAQYCTVERGWHLGVTGSSYPSVCAGSPHEHEFKSGWESGIRQYCSNSSLAQNLGESGKAYPSICAQSMYPHFKSAYDKGIEEYLKKAK